MYNGFRTNPNVLTYMGYIKCVYNKICLNIERNILMYWQVNIKRHVLEQK